MEESFNMPGKRKRSENAPGLRVLRSGGASPKIKPEPKEEEGSNEGSATPKTKKRRTINRLLKKSQQFAKQLTQKTDFTIICDGYNVAVHSMLLSCRSPVFDAMFGGKFFESINHEMTIDDSQPEDLIEFLKFFYPKLQEKLRLRRGNVAQILYLAEKYQVPAVKDMCEQSIEHISASERTVARTMPWLKVAFDYNMFELQRNIVLRISKRFPDFDRTPTFRALPSELKLELMKQSKLVITDRLEKLRKVAFNDEMLASGYRSDQSVRSNATSYKSRVINMQALFTQWKDGDPSSPDLEPEEPGIDSENAETDGDESADELP